MRGKALIFIVLVGYGAFHHFQHRSIVHGAGEIAPEEPLQESSSMAQFQRDDFTLTPLASYAITARVLSTEDYFAGTEAKLSPVDLALGWGPMSDEAVLDKVKISQSHRFFYWHVDQFPIPQQQIEMHAANMHIIPANDLIEQQIAKVRVGQLVALKGQLVEAKKADGWHWRSSLSRNDTGNGACELMYVTEFTVR